MKSLLVSATEFEIAPFLSHFGLKSGLNYLNGNQIFVLITGVGMVATAFSMGNILATDKFDFAVNAGIAGSFSTDIELGEVVIVTGDCFSELGAMDGQSFLPIEELGFGKSVFTPLQGGPLEGLYSTHKGVRGITVNCVHGDDMEIASISERLNPAVETMEGAAFFYSCDQVGLPSAQLRSISNYVERRDKSRWNIPLAIEMLNRRLINIYTAI